MQITTNFREEFNRAAKLLWGTETKKELVEFTNQIALKVVTGSLDNTRVASPEDIRHKMGVVSENLRLAKKGKFAGQLRRVTGKNRFGFSGMSLAMRIIKSQDRKGNHLFPGGSLEVRATKLINAKVRSSAYIKQGWIPALSKLRNVVRGRGTFGNIFGTQKDMRRGKVHVGDARPATLIGSDMFVVSVENKLLSGKQSLWFGKATDPSPVGTEGLEKGFRAATVDMLDHLRRRLEKRLARKS